MSDLFRNHIVGFPTRRLSVMTMKSTIKETDILISNMIQVIYQQTTLVAEFKCMDVSACNLHQIMIELGKIMVELGKNVQIIPQQSNHQFLD